MKIYTSIIPLHKENASKQLKLAAVLLCVLPSLTCYYPECCTERNTTKATI